MFSQGSVSYFAPAAPLKPGFVAMVCLASVLFCGPSLSAQPGGAIDVADRLQLFVDDVLVDHLETASLRLHHPTDEGPVLYFDRPWEGPFSGYATVIQDGDLFRLYYRGSPVVRHDGAPTQILCYAESRDGVQWTKPELDLYPMEGADRTNVVLAGVAPVTHNFTPFLDTRPDTPPGQRFKGLGGTMESGLVAFASADGLRWEQLFDEPVLDTADVDFPYMFDSQNVSFWSPAEGRYVLYFRVFDGGIRSIARTTSTDFRRWSTPVLMSYVHAGRPAPTEHLYTNQTHPYVRAPHLYLSIGARFFPGRQVLSEAQAERLGVDPAYYKDASDAFFMTTRVAADGTARPVYQRTYLESFIRPGIGPENWVSRTNYPALNVVQTSPTELSLYVNQNYAQPTAHLRRYTLRVDGFASVHAGSQQGHLITHPLLFSGDRLLVNFASSAAGGMRVALLDENGIPIPGFDLGSSIEQIGNEIDREISWEGHPNLGALAGTPVRLHVVLRDADLFSFRFAADR